MFESYEVQLPKLKKLASFGTYPVRNVKPVKNVKKTTNSKNAQLVNFDFAPNKSISPKIISKTIIATEKAMAYLENVGKMGAKNENHVPSKVDSNSVKYC